MTVIIKPVVTEKMTEIGEKLNQYAFIVDRRANKIEIKKALESLYDVDIVSVNTMVYSGKKKTRYTKSSVQTGRTKSYKKAIVTLAKGQIIDFYSNI
jgi:large subunit ribosomal protein L23